MKEKKWNWRELFGICVWKSANTKTLNNPEVEKLKSVIVGMFYVGESTWANLKLRKSKGYITEILDSFSVQSPSTWHLVEE